MKLIRKDCLTSDIYFSKLFNEIFRQFLLQSKAQSMKQFDRTLVWWTFFWHSEFFQFMLRKIILKMKCLN